MLTLLGSFLGFISSALPDMLKIWKNYSSYKHNITLMNMQIAAQKQSHLQELDKINLQKDILETQSLYAHASLPIGQGWVETLRASVRPVITYGFFALFALVKLVTFANFLSKNGNVADSIILIWDAETQVLFATIISFWFGQRALMKLHH